MIKRWTQNQEVQGPIPTQALCCVLEQDRLTFHSTGKYPGSSPNMTKNVDWDVKS